MRYMRGLNEWLGRDVHDRQSELRGVANRVEELRRDLGRLAPGPRPPGKFSLLVVSAQLFIDVMDGKMGNPRHSLFHNKGWVLRLVFSHTRSNQVLYRPLSLSPSVEIEHPTHPLRR